MDVDLDPLEQRVIGCLIEKQISAPDVYPLSLNALTGACNQKSNREPVLALDEATVLATLDGLRRKRLVAERSGFGSRVTKYAQLFCNTEFGRLQFDAQELAVICELLLRGPQTPGELRTRAGRLCSFADAGEVEATLQRLIAREGGAAVARLAREPGRRESRYAHRFGAAPPALEVAEASGPAPEQGGPSLEERLAALEREVAELRRALAALQSDSGPR